MSIRPKSPAVYYSTDLLFKEHHIIFQEVMAFVSLYNRDYGLNLSGISVISIILFVNRPLPILVLSRVNITVNIRKETR